MPVPMMAFTHILAGKVSNSPEPPNLTMPLVPSDHPPCSPSDAPFNLTIAPPALKPLRGSLSSMLAISKFTTSEATENYATKKKFGFLGDYNAHLRGKGSDKSYSKKKSPIETMSSQVETVSPKSSSCESPSHYPVHAHLSYLRHVK